MPHYCCVPQCNNNSTLNDRVTFHIFPNQSQRRIQWIQAIRRIQAIKRGSNFNINRESRVCSAHFNETDYHPFKEGFSQRKRLLATAVPSIFQFTTVENSRSPRKRKARRSSRKRKARRSPRKRKALEEETPVKKTPSISQETELIVVDVEHQQPSTSQGTELIVVDVEHQQPSTSQLEKDEFIKKILEPSSSSTCSSKCQEDEPDSPIISERYKQLLASSKKFSLWRFCSNDKDIKFYTGFPSYIALKCFFEYLQPAASYLYYVGQKNVSGNKPLSELKSRGKPRQFHPMEELFIVLVRLRKAVHERILADMVGVTQGTISKIVNTWVIFLANRFSFLPIFPNREYVKENMPECFTAHYPTTRVVIDCSEIKIQKPSATFTQRELYSKYKSANTAKFLVAMAPSGEMVFISALYTGRVSDKNIVKHCGLLDLLEPGDNIMADRGFDVEDILKRRNLHFNIPPFTNGREQFTSEEVDKTKDIAAVRVHVERLIGQIKNFKIIGETVDITMAPMLEKIVYVCAHLSNFTSSLMKQDPRCVEEPSCSQTNQTIM